MFCSILIPTNARNSCHNYLTKFDRDHVTYLSYLVQDVLSTAGKLAICDCIERVRKHSKGLHASGLTPISDAGNNTCAIYGEKKRLSEEFATVYFNLQIVFDSSATL